MLGSEKRFVAAFAAAAIALGVAGCGSSDDDAGTTEANAQATTGKCDASAPAFTILSVSDQSGATKPIGERQLMGLNASAEYVNEERGGMLGRCVEVKGINSTGDPATASQVLLRALGSGDKPDMVWAGTTTPEVAATLPVLVRNGVFTMTPSHLGDKMLTGAGENYPHVFTTFLPQAGGGQAEQAIAWAKEQGAKKLGFLRMEYPIGDTLSEELKKLTAEAGLEYVERSYAADALDLTPQVSALRDAGVDALYQAGIGPTTAVALKAPRKIGWDVPMLFTAAGVDLTTLASPKELENTQILSQYADVLPEDHPGIVALRKHAAPAKVGGVPISVVSAPWDAVLTVNHAAQKAGKLDADSLSSTLEGIGTINDELFVFSSAIGGYSAENHQNTAGIENGWVPHAVGPIKDGLIQANSQ